MKKSSRSSRIGRAGIDLIARRVGQMGHHWHPGSGDLDTGVDGEIELVDPANDEVRNFRIGVQSKATEGIWRSETEDGFLWKAEPKDIDYWLGGNQPVLLVCSRPRSDEAYFRNVQQWASDPQARATGLIDFDKHRDRFDTDAADRLFTVEAREPLVLEPPGPIIKSESVKSNLMPIHWQTSGLWVVPAPSEHWGDWFSKALEAGVARTDLAMREGRLWSLTEFSPLFLEAIGVTSKPDVLPLESYTASDDRDRINLLAEIVRKTLISIHHGQLRWSAVARVAYFKLYSDRPERKFKWGRGTGRTVVKPRQSLRHEGLSGYRHDAAEIYVKRLGGDMYVAVTPTYLFTQEGRQLSSFHSEALKKMKAQDRASAVSQQLRMWEFLLAERGQLGGDEGPFRLGSLVEVELPVTPPERAWIVAPADLVDDADLGTFDDGAAGEPTLFDDMDGRE
jgi:hypothetical protein